MDDKRAAELARQKSLGIDDWLEITDIPIGRYGEYLVKDDGVRFHPNKDSAYPGWSTEQIDEAQASKPGESRADAQRQARANNNSALPLPCTPRQLVDFMLTQDVSGDLHGALPGIFIAAVYEHYSQQPNTSAPKETIPLPEVPATGPTFPYTTKHLEAMREAAIKHWANHDRSKPAPYGIQKAVQSFLAERTGENARKVAELAAAIKPNDLPKS